MLAWFCFANGQHMMVVVVAVRWIDGCSAALLYMYSREFNKHFSTSYHDVDDDDGDFMFMSNFISILKKKEGN